MCVNSHYLRTLFILWNGKTLFSLVHHGQRSAGSPDSPPDLESIYIRGLVENLDSLLNVTMALVWLRYDHVDGKDLCVCITFKKASTIGMVRKLKP